MSCSEMKVFEDNFANRRTGDVKLHWGCKPHPLEVIRNAFAATKPNSKGRLPQGCLAAWISGSPYLGYGSFYSAPLWIMCAMKIYDSLAFWNFVQISSGKLNYPGPVTLSAEHTKRRTSTVQFRCALSPLSIFPGYHHHLMAWSGISQTRWHSWRRLAPHWPTPVNRQVQRPPQLIPATKTYLSHTSSCTATLRGAREGRGLLSCHVHRKSLSGGPTEKPYRNFATNRLMNASYRNESISKLKQQK